MSLHHLPSIAVLSLAFALQQTTPPPVTSPKPSPAATPASQGAASARPGALTLTVVSEKGEVLSGAAVAAHGAVDRAGVSGADGIVTTQNMPPGTYRCRITRDGFITLDKEVTIRAGARTTAEAVLSAAPPPPPPPPPPPTERKPPATQPAGAPGTSRVLSIPDLAEQMLRESQGTLERELGCSGVAKAKLITTRENIPMHRHPDADDLVYLVAGDATLTIGDKDQSVSAGWFGLVPRGTSYSFVRRGRSPMVVLSVESGVPCGGTQAQYQRER